MSDFVEECRREWKRLGVPDAVANEMAADVAADLAEAEAEGASAEEVLGTEAFDPRSFAAAWAFSRGVAERPSPNGRGSRRWLVVAAVAAFALVAIAGVVLTVVDPSSTSETGDVLRRGAVWTFAPRPGGDAFFVLPAPESAAGDSMRVVASPLPLFRASTTKVSTDDSGLDTRTLGYILLAIGLAGAVGVCLGRVISAAGRSPRLPMTV